MPQDGKLPEIDSLLSSNDIPVKDVYRPVPRSGQPINYTTDANEQREGWELVNQFNFNKSDTKGFYSEVAPLDTRSDDTRSIGRVLEPFDSSMYSI
jgi:hypothetical protein